MFTRGKNNKLGLYALISMCVGSMIGAGLFALPQNVACKAGVAASLIAWIITFLGMICLAKVFQNLSLRCPNLDAGVYSYAKEGFGDYLGFNSAWGYWLSAWIGNVGYVIMLCAALSPFFPVFGDGTTWPALILSSIIIWAVTYLCICGIKSATTMNIITTIAKIVPIIIFIALAIYAFKPHVFTADIWRTTTNLGSITTQIKNVMLVTVWVFIGIEGASVFSARAKNRRDIGKATIISFLLMFFILFAISILPFGILSQEKIAMLNHPSTGAVLAYIIGDSGNAFMSIGLIVSVLGAFLSWILLAAEVPFIAGKKDGLFPKVFTIENKTHFPSGALIITAICQQIYLIIIHFYYHAAYLTTILLATAMILLPYLFAAFYALQLVVSGKTYETATTKERFKDLFVSMIAVAYGVWLLLYAAGKYLLPSSILYLTGAAIFIGNKIGRRQKIFCNKIEMVLCLIFSLLGVGCIIALMLGKITL